MLTAPPGALKRYETSSPNQPEIHAVGELIGRRSGVDDRAENEQAADGPEGGGSLPTRSTMEPRSEVVVTTLTG